MKEKFYQKKNGRLIGECFEQIYEIISENSISKKKIKIEKFETEKWILERTLFNAIFNCFFEYFNNYYNYIINNKEAFAKDKMVISLGILFHLLLWIFWHEYKSFGPLLRA